MYQCDNRNTVYAMQQQAMRAYQSSLGLMLRNDQHLSTQSLIVWVLDPWQNPCRAEAELAPCPWDPRGDPPWVLPGPLRDLDREPCAPWGVPSWNPRGSCVWGLGKLHCSSSSHPLDSLHGTMFLLYYYCWLGDQVLPYSSHQMTLR